MILKLSTFRALLFEFRFQQGLWRLSGNDSDERSAVKGLRHVVAFRFMNLPQSEPKIHGVNQCEPHWRFKGTAHLCLDDDFCSLRLFLGYHSLFCEGAPPSYLRNQALKENLCNLLLNLHSQ